MDSQELQQMLKRLTKVMWEANVTNPITYVTQISYILFLKMLEEWEVDRGDEPYNLFETHKVDGQEVDYSKLRWSVLTSDPDNDRMLKVLRETLPLLARHPNLSRGARAIFVNASVVIPNGATLRRAVDIVAPISFITKDADVKGDLFEMLSSDLGSQKKAAQFRTPRHLIRVITEMVNPKIGETVCDPACGTGGFLIAAYEHVLLQNTDPEFIRIVTSPYGGQIERGIGNRLTKAEWKFLLRGTMHGFDSDVDILRMTAMNALLHQFDESPIISRDSICGSEDKWDEVQFDVILENPPFSGARSDAKPFLRVSKGDKYVLFLAHALRTLAPGGRAGIIFPQGLLFGDSKSHLAVKQHLLENFDLQAIVSLPKGMFMPYTINPTCFLIFQNSGKPTKDVWYYRVLGDGSSLSTARKFGPQYRNDFPDLLSRWQTRSTSPDQAWVVPAADIVDAGYNMTLSGLRLLEREVVKHQSPLDIIDQVAANQAKVGDLLVQIRKVLEEGTADE